MKDELEEKFGYNGDRRKCDVDLFFGFICDCKHCEHCIMIYYATEHYYTMKLPVKSQDDKYWSCPKCYGIPYVLTSCYTNQKCEKDTTCPTCDNKLEGRIGGVYGYKHTPKTAFELLRSELKPKYQNKSDKEIMDDICCCIYCENCTTSQNYLNDKVCKKCGKNNITLFLLSGKYFPQTKFINFKMALKELGVE
jgi:hypothetical protein